MGLGEPGSLESLAGFLCEESGADRVDILRHERLSGGAIQENHGIDVSIVGGPMAGQHALVVRSDAPSGLAESLSRAQEFRVVQAAHAAGATVPEPLWLCEDPALIGRAFYIMRRVPGMAAAHRVVRDDAVAANRDGLAAQCAGALADIHRITPGNAVLDFLAMPSPSPALAGVARFRGYLDMLDLPYPGFEWGLRWLERNAPEPDEIVLVHHDFRTGNLMIEDGQLTGVLDWEFTCWSEPHEDIGWLCARCWRFGAWHLEAGGIADRAPFYRFYEAASGRTIDPERVYYWEVFAHMRWGILALHQGRRHLSGEEPSLHLALTGRMAAEMELEMIEDDVAIGPYTDMMRDQPDAAELLAIARTVLREDVAPGLTGEARFNVLMVANAMAMAIREIQQGADLDAAERTDLTSLYRDADAAAEDLGRRLATDIRAGRFDADALAAKLHRLLLADIRRRLAIANPRYLAESDGTT